MTDRERTPRESLPQTCEGRDGHHSCRSCPACGTELCRLNQELGMFCDTQIAATEATRARRTRRRRSGETARPIARARPHTAAASR